MHRRTETDGQISYKIPIHADFLIAYSTIPGTTLCVILTYNSLEVC